MMRLLTITTPNSENGTGCRVTLWFAGCSNHCEFCQNKHTWDYNQGLYIWDKNVLDKIYEEVDKDYIAGITLSGGDPLSQPNDNLKDLIKFLKKFKEDFPNKNIWVYSGSTYEDLCQNSLKKDVLDLCDILVDGPFIKDLYDPDLAFRGSSNQRIIDLTKTKNCDKIIEVNIK